MAVTMIDAFKKIFLVSEEKTGFSSADVDRIFGHEQAAFLANDGFISYGSNIFMHMNILGTTDKILSTFLSGWAKTRGLMLNGVIDEELYNAWVEKKIREYKHVEIVLNDTGYSVENMDADNEEVMPF